MLLYDSIDVSVTLGLSILLSICFTPAQLLKKSSYNNIAHTRQRTVIGEIKGAKKKILKGSSITVQTLCDTMEEATSYVSYIIETLPGVEAPFPSMKNIKLIAGWNWMLPKEVII